MLAQSENSGHCSLPEYDVCAGGFHHWQNILRHKAEGLSSYDFGDWYAGKADGASLRINKFKERFGVDILKVYDFELAVTPQGKLALWFRRVFLRWRPEVDLVGIVAIGKQMYGPALIRQSGKYIRQNQERLMWGAVSESAMKPVVLVLNAIQLFERTEIPGTESDERLHTESTGDRIGRVSTEEVIVRVLEGLEGKTTASVFDRR